MIYNDTNKLLLHLERQYTELYRVHLIMNGTHNCSSDSKFLRK